MASFKYYNIARMTVASAPGTGTITLGVAVSSFLSFAGAGISNGELVTYTIEDGANREIGRGTYTSAGTTLARTTILNSTNAGSAITATANAQVFITAAAQDFPWAIDTSTGALMAPANVNVGVGAAVTPDSALTLNTNTVATSVAPNAGTVFHVVGADTVNSRLLFDAFAASPIFNFRKANGTAASPSAVISGSSIGQIASFGYGATAYSGSRTQVNFFAGEAWSDTAQGAYVTIFTTPLTTATAAESVRFNPSGGFSVGTTSDPGIGLIYMNSASFLMRTKTSWTNGAGVALGTLTTAPSAGNPTKWIPVDDNGTTRYIPAW